MTSPTLRQKRHHAGHDQEHGAASDRDGSGALKRDHSPHPFAATHLKPMAYTHHRDVWRWYGRRVFGARTTSARRMMPPSVRTPRNASETRRAKQLSGMANASNRSRFIATSQAFAPRNCNSISTGGN